MAETGRQSEIDSLRKNFQYDAAKKAYESSGSYGSGQGNTSFGSSSVNFGDILKQVQSTISGQLNPIAETLKAQQPAISQAYSTAKTTLQGAQSSLKDKYQKLLSDIKNVGTQQTNTATKTTNTELARRGITSDSTAAGQELASVLNPIQNQILAQENAATAAQGDEEQAIANAIANLGISEQSAQSGVLQQVANLLAGGVSTGTSLGGSIYSQLLGNEQANRVTETQKIQNQLLQQQLTNAQNTAPLELQKLQAEIKKLLAPAQKTVSLDALSSLWDS